MTDEKWLILLPEKLVFGISPRGTIAVKLDYPREELGIAPHTHLAMELSPREARGIAEILLRKAEEAEANSLLN